VTSRNYLKDYSDFQKDIRQQKVDVIKSSRDQILNRLDQLKQERFDRSMALKQLGMQQAQIDQANRALDAQIKYETAMANLMLKKYKDKHNGDGRRRDDTTETTTPEFGYPYWGKSETQFGGQPTGALQPAGPPPQTPLSPTAEPYTLVQWLQTQPLQTQAGLQAATAQIMQWLQAHGQEAVLAADGTLSLSTLASPVVYDVIQHFNAMIGGA
jgi:hypothetical protein